MAGRPYCGGRRLTVYFNGRFLSQPVTGVQRYAREVVYALDGLLEAGAIPHAPDAFVLLAPPGTAQPRDLRHVTVRAVGRRHGHAWEQLELPRAARNALLVGLCNTAPLRHPRQIVTIHDASVFAVPGTYSRLFGAWYRFLLPRLVRRAATVVTDSAFSRTELQRFAGASSARTAVVPLSGEHVLRTPPDAGVFARLGPLERPYLLAVGSRSPHKNLAGLVQALALLDRPAFDVVIAGGGNGRVFAGSDGALPPYVRHAGYVSDAELRALYDRATGFVFPSLYEGFGLPPLEAMTCGCPVLVSRAASLPEVCGDAALYCDPTSPADIARGITSLMGDAALRATLTARGTQRARSFTWERSARELLAVIDEVAG